MFNVAKHIIQKCKGPDAVSRYAGVHVSRVYRWTYPRERGGCDGGIPRKRQLLIMKNARADGIDISPSDFFPQAQQRISTQVNNVLSPVSQDIEKRSEVVNA